jgi:hypothetical protein
MDANLIRLIRDRYPFPIAYAHKKTLTFLDDNAQKLKCLIQTAETVIQFLALVMLGQVRRDLEYYQDQAPALNSRGGQLWEELRNPSFGKWQGILRDTLKCYGECRHLLVMPELFDFYFTPARGKKLRIQPVVSQAIEPLITLRNQFHHPGIPDTLIAEKVLVGMRWLEQMLVGLQFLSAYQLAFVQEIKVRRHSQGNRFFSHDLIRMNGHSTPFEHERWESDVDLQYERIVLFAPSTSSHTLFLHPFITVADQIPVPGVLDVFLLNGTEQQRARYLSVQFSQELTTDQPAWSRGQEHLEALAQFFALLRHSPTAEAEVELEGDGQTPSALLEVRSNRSTEDVFAARYKRAATAPRHGSPYKFLDYFEPEDAELFFGREQEIRQLQRKFYDARLLILYGESGTGKTSLIRAGLIPQLPTESYMPVYVRTLQEPTRAVKDAMIRQLGVDRHHIDWPLVPFLEGVTTHLSKTVVIILDQFEEFFLRFPPEVRRGFPWELRACMDASLDIRVMIALREDYFALLAEFQEAIPDIFTHQMYLSRLTAAQALAAAVEPVKRVGLTMDETLLAEVILPQLDEAGQGIAPPLLQIVCDALYQHAQDAGRTVIGVEDYVAIGEVRQALGRYLDTTLRQFGREQPQARAVLKALVTAEGTKRASFVGEITSRLQTMGVDLPAETIEQKFLHKLVQARLVRAEEVEGQTRYELTHEFLVQKIGEWIAESERELTKILELIDRAYEAYRTTKLLLEPRALELIAPFERELVLPPEKREFLELSRHTASKQRRKLWLKVGVLLLGMGLSVAGAFAWQLWQQYQKAVNKTGRIQIQDDGPSGIVWKIYPRAGDQEDETIDQWNVLTDLPNVVASGKAGNPPVEVKEGTYWLLLYRNDGGRPQAIPIRHRGYNNYKQPLTVSTLLFPTYDEVLKGMQRIEGTMNLTISKDESSLIHGPKKDLAMNLSPFYVDNDIVSFNDYQVFVNQSDRKMPVKGNNFYLNWYDAHAYCLWRRKRLLTATEVIHLSRLKPDINVYVKEDKLNKKIPKSNVRYVDFSLKEFIWDFQGEWIKIDVKGPPPFPQYKMKKSYDVITHKDNWDIMFGYSGGYNPPSTRREDYRFRCAFSEYDYTYLDVPSR